MSSKRASVSNPAPIKRDKALQQVSREHHHGLLLCWKIRTGISKNVPLERIKRYTDWFFKNHLIPHFELEEKLIFPILGKDNKLIKRAMTEHRRLFRLFKSAEELHKKLNQIEEELAGHIRFEERILFTEIQKIATPGQLKLISECHSEEKFIENQTDMFWK